MVGELQLSELEGRLTLYARVWQDSQSETTQEYTQIHVHDHTYTDRDLCRKYTNIRATYIHIAGKNGQRTRGKKWPKLKFFGNDVSSRAASATMDKLNEACTNADDSMMLVRHRGGDRVMNWRGFGVIS